MKYLQSFLLSIGLLTSIIASEVKDDLRAIDPYLVKDLDSAYLLSKDLLMKVEKTNDQFGLVKANLYLGYITFELNDFGKSVIYYLDGIRRAEDANYDGVEVDRIWLRRNLANTFRYFEANSLATKYNLEAIEIASNANITDQIIMLKLNQALVFENDQQYSRALPLLEEILSMNINTDLRSEIFNQIGIVYHKDNNLDSALDFYRKVLEITDESAKIRTFKAKAFHNIGEIQYKTGDLDGAIHYLNQAISLLEREETIEKRDLFLSYRNIGQFLFLRGNFDEAESYLNKAVDYSQYANKDVSSFNVYKTLSDLFYRKGNNNLGQKYSQLYFDKVQEYLETQEVIKKKDKEYNFDLITKRYFDEVEKQERIASIMFWSKLSSGSLLTILLLVIAFNRYEKMRLRKTIEKELVSLRIIE